MRDLIDRAEAIEHFFRKENELAVKNRHRPIRCVFAEGVACELKKLPTIDAVEVVRCKDCKHFRRNLENDTYCDCVGGLDDPEENDFCSYGEQEDTE